MVKRPGMGVMSLTTVLKSGHLGGSGVAAGAVAAGGVWASAGSAAEATKEAAMAAKSDRLARSSRFINSLRKWTRGPARTRYSNAMSTLEKCKVLRRKAMDVSPGAGKLAGLL